MPDPEYPGTPRAPASGSDSAQDKSDKRAARRTRRNLRKAAAEGYLEGICAMLRPGDLALDCGANMGVVTAQLAATGAEVIAFEPDPFAFAHLTQRFAEQANVTLVNAALGVEEGQVILNRAENFDSNPQGASVKSTIMPGGRAIARENGIEVRLADTPALIETLIAERGEIAFVKMDIEGAELDILEALDNGGQLERIRCLVAETHERKFKHLRPRFRTLRRRLEEKYPRRKVNLDWI
ncbi:FkbM family methyltransferase [Profundibacterium mesophilum]|uniref:Trans-aconitate 2-methyltransferase n=1 Tax=Profundibacterium mesophilum KAUST100406-0324 TaxID=1037889 RepID=A0A921NQX7_9RHOB|nr:FkbM family methyltransferase [Profundibacterium mesophilum]KAF0676807.1 trans-aconitate 2-methyltransferase [Profundibacterium mesophilum KAUST100406-0324]